MVLIKYHQSAFYYVTSVILVMKTTVFLGAGASVFAGIPTTKELIKNISNHIKPESWKDPTLYHMCTDIVEKHRAKDVEVLYQTIDNMIKAENIHMEVAEHRAQRYSGSWKRKIHTFSKNPNAVKSEAYERDDIEETIKVLESLRTIIRDTLLDSLIVEPDKVNEVENTYDSLFQHIQQPYIVTTNYDNVLETYCKRKEIGLVNGFRQSSLGDGRIWDGMFDEQERALHLVKLHGSITWQEVDDGSTLEIGMPGQRNSTGDVMIVPTLGEKDYSSKIFPRLLEKFKSILNNTDLLIVIGFSFRDPGINQMFAQRLDKNNPNPMMLWLIDPNHNGLKRLVGNVEPRRRQAESGVVWDYSNDKMPYVYAQNIKFPRKPHEWEHQLKILDQIQRQN